MVLPRQPHPGDLIALEPAECHRLLQQAPWARLAFTDDRGWPQILPVTHLVVDGAVAFRTAPGPLLGLAVAGGRVAVQVDGGLVPERVGWSVLATGTAGLIEDEDELERLFALPFEPWAAPGDRPHWVRIELETISGRRIEPHHTPA